MCGISGVLNRYADGPVDEPALRAMTESMHHRGPDGGGIWLGPGAGLGHRRLTILDLSDASAQPFVLKDERLAMTYNGEIYNYLELRAELQSLGHVFHTSGDTEVLLRGYLEWGTGVVARLNGMFAFAIVDYSTRRLFAARDPMGQKPWLYFLDATGLVFASELTALMAHPRCPKEISRLSLSRYLALDFVPGSDTMLQGVRRLEPGHALLYNPDSHLVDTWGYERPPENLRPYESYGELPTTEDYDRLAELFRASVSRTLRSDVPVGVYLSGGIDSTAAALFGTQSLRSGERLRTYTVRFTEPGYNEADLAADTARRLGTLHEEVTIDPQHIAKSIPRLAASLDEPLADLGYLAVAQVAEFAARHVKVVLSGDGGDEFFYGYEPFLKWRYAKLLDAVPRPLVRGLKALLRQAPAQYGYMGLRYKAEVFLRAHRLPDALKNSAWAGGYLPEELKAFGVRGSEASEIYPSILSLHESASHLASLDRLGREYQRSYLPGVICAHTDKANMRYSLEARSPFLDNELRWHAATLPHRWKVRRGVGKWMVRELIRRELPGSPIPYARKKGFTVPLALWMRGELKEWAGSMLFASGPLSLKDYVDPSRIQTMWAQHQKGQGNYYKQLWPWIVFQSWRDRKRAEAHRELPTKPLGSALLSQ